MSDLVLRAAGHAVCAASLTIFALIFGLATFTSANAKSALSCRYGGCPGLVWAQPDKGLTAPAHVRAVALHLWGVKPVRG